MYILILKVNKQIKFVFLLYSNYYQIYLNENKQTVKIKNAIKFTIEKSISSGIIQILVTALCKYMLQNE